MTVKRVAAIFVACAGFLTGVSFGAGAAAAEELPACATPTHLSDVVRHESPGRWVYTFQVAWCAEDGATTWIEPIVGHEILDPRCTWVGNMEESELPVPGTKDWRVFNMSAFSCENPDGSVTDDNPWAIVGVSPNGHSSLIAAGVD